MIKRAVVEEGKSPALEDGKPCRFVEKGEPVKKKGMAKQASLPEVRAADKKKQR